MELDKMLATRIIELVKESKWVSPMVVQENKTKGEIRICVDLSKLNDACLHDPFPTPFTDEVLDNVEGQEVYSFTNGFSGYHHIRIAPEDRSKVNIVLKVLIVMKLKLVVVPNKKGVPKLTLVAVLKKKGVSELKI